MIDFWTVVDLFSTHLARVNNRNRSTFWCFITEIGYHLTYTHTLCEVSPAFKTKMTSTTKKHFTFMGFIRERLFHSSTDIFCMIFIVYGSQRYQRLASIGVICSKTWFDRFICNAFTFLIKMFKAFSRIWTSPKSSSGLQMIDWKVLNEILSRNRGKQNDWNKDRWVEHSV